MRNIGGDIAKLLLPYTVSCDVRMNREPFNDGLISTVADLPLSRTASIFNSRRSFRGFLLTSGIIMTLGSGAQQSGSGHLPSLTNYAVNDSWHLLANETVPLQLGRAS